VNRIFISWTRCHWVIEKLSIRYILLIIYTGKFASVVFRSVLLYTQKCLESCVFQKCFQPEEIGCGNEDTAVARSLGSEEGRAVALGISYHGLL
jgi:hypothetical protein